MTVTASIVTHNTPITELRKAVGCLLQSVVERIYIIDNSDDYRLKWIKEDDDRIDYRHVANDGYGAGHNIAIREAMKAGAKYHLVMNADVYWSGDVIEALSEYMEANPDVGMVMPKVYYPNGDLQYTCRMLPTPADLFMKRFLPAIFTKKRMERYLLANHDHDLPLNCPYLLGSFLFFRMKALEEEGMFDERFFMYPEDIDITRRIHRNWKTMYWPGASIVHAHQAASRRDGKMLRIHLVNMVKYFNKWGWFIDGERRRYNRALLEALRPLPEGTTPPSARG